MSTTEVVSGSTATFIGRVDVTSYPLTVCLVELAFSWNTGAHRYPMYSNDGDGWYRVSAPVATNIAEDAWHEVTVWVKATAASACDMGDIHTHMFTSGIYVRAPYPWHSLVDTLVLLLLVALVVSALSTGARMRALQREVRESHMSPEERRGDIFAFCPKCSGKVFGGVCKNCGTRL